MPTYTFRNNDNDEEIDVIMSISEKEEFLKENKNYTQLLKKPLVIGYSIHRQKPDNEFRSMLKSMKKANRNSTINDF